MVECLHRRTTKNSVAVGTNVASHGLSRYGGLTKSPYVYIMQQTGFVFACIATSLPTGFSGLALATVATLTASAAITAPTAASLLVLLIFLMLFVLLVLVALLSITGNESSSAVA